MATPVSTPTLGRSTSHQPQGGNKTGQFDCHRIKLFEGKEVPLYIRDGQPKSVLQGSKTLLERIPLEQRGQVSVLKHLPNAEISSPRALFQTTIEVITTSSWSIILNCRTNHFGAINNTVLKFACHDGGMISEDVTKACNTLQREIDILTPLEHPNIVKMIGFIPAGAMRQTALMMIPLYREVLSKCPASTPRQQKIRYAQDLFAGLHYLHSNGVLHRDIKPLNCMIDDGQHLVIIDFGFACSLGSQQTITDEQKGTPYFMAPEIQQADINKQCHYNYGVDIYAATLVTAQLLSLTRTKHLPAYQNRYSILRWKQPQQWLQEHKIIAPQLASALRHTELTLKQWLESSSTVCEEPALQDPKIQNIETNLQLFLVAQGIRPEANHRPTADRMLSDLQALERKNPAEAGSSKAGDASSVTQ